MLHPATHARLAISGLLVLAIVSFCPADQVVNILLNSGAEEATDGRPADWYAACVPAPQLRMWLDGDEPFGGKACLAISSDDMYERPVSNNWAQKIGFIPVGKTVRLGGYIRTQDAEAVNLCVQCWNAEERMIGFASTPVFRGTHDWLYVQAPDIVVPAETTELIVRAALTGKGKACFDDLLLAIVGEAAVADSGLATQIQGRILSSLPVIKDSMVLSYMQDWNNGDVDNIAVANYKGGVRTLLAWQEPPLEQASQPNLRFILAMYCRQARLKTQPAPSLQMHEILEDWNEIVSWSKRPRSADQPVARFDVPPGDGWKTFDVTAIVRAHAMAQAPSHGLVLRFGAEDLPVEDGQWCDYGFVSREGVGEWENRRPVLLVVDPDQPPASQPVVSRPAAKPPVLTGEAFLEYIDYLAAMPNVRIESVPGAKWASLEAVHKAVNSETSQMGSLQRDIPDPAQRYKAMQLPYIQFFEEFVQRYPLTPEGLEKMGSLASIYQRVDRSADALRLSTAAMRLSRDTDLCYATQVGHAQLEAQLGRLDAAEARLREVMAQPSAREQDARTRPILFWAPEALAKVLKTKGRYEEADRVLQELFDHAVSYNREHPDEKHIGHSWGMTAYGMRIDLMLERNVNDVDAARALAREFQEKMPDCRPRLGYPNPDPAWTGYDELNLRIGQSLDMLRMPMPATQASQPSEGGS